MIASAVTHLPCPHIGVVDGYIGALDEAQAEQATGCIERRLHHVVEDEVRLHLGLVEVVFRLGGPFRHSSASPMARSPRSVRRPGLPLRAWSARHGPCPWPAPKPAAADA